MATIQLSAEEKERYKDCHIYLDYQTGLYTFPVSFLLLLRSCEWSRAPGLAGKTPGLSSFRVLVILFALSSVSNDMVTYCSVPVGS